MRPSHSRILFIRFRLQRHKTHALWNASCPFYVPPEPIEEKIMRCRTILPLVALFIETLFVA